MRKRIFLSAAILAAAVSAYAQGNGQAGITEATNLITGYFDPGTKLVYAIGAVCGLIGGGKVYNKFSSGDPDTSKTAASWFGGVHLPDCRRHYPAVVLPLNQRLCLNIR